MRKILLLLVALFASFSLFAQDAALAKIAAANSKAGNVQASFEQSKVIAASGRVIKSDGVLYFSENASLAMVYDQPDGDLLVISGNSVKMTRSGKTSIYDTSKNARMRGLKSILLNCIGGTPDVAAEDNGTTLKVNELSDGYVVTLEAPEGQTMGYSLITLTYRKSDCMLIRMKMTEASGISTTYSISDIHTSASFDSAVFAL